MKKAARDGNQWKENVLRIGQDLSEKIVKRNLFEFTLKCLAGMQVIGGWADAKTLNKVYTHTQMEDIEIARRQMAQMYAS